MRVFFEEIFSAQNPPPGSREGIPYWTFWLLLCIILLLVTFIFLRDKDLRKRVDSFFFGAKKKIIKLRLQARLKKQKQKKKDVLKELGQKAWQEGIEPEENENVNNELRKLEENQNNLDKELKGIESNIDKLNSSLKANVQECETQITNQNFRKKPHCESLRESKDKEKQIETVIAQMQNGLEATAKEISSLKTEAMGQEENGNLAENEKKTEKKEIKKKIKNLETIKETKDQKIIILVGQKLTLEKESQKHQEKIDKYDEKIKTTEEEKKQQTQEFQKEIKEWEKSKVKVYEKIRTLDKKGEPLFIKLGELADKSRIEHKELVIFYSRIDRTNKRINGIGRHIKELE